MEFQRRSASSEVLRIGSSSGVHCSGSLVFRSLHYCPPSAVPVNGEVWSSVSPSGIEGPSYRRALFWMAVCKSIVMAVGATAPTAVFTV
jgi:hypothetical protein